MNKKFKKALKYTGIVIGVVIGTTGVVVTTYVLIKHPEVGNEVVGGFKKGCKKISSYVGETKTEPQEPRREGRNSGGYYRPRYNNKKN